MGLYDNLPSGLREVDVIIAGGGTAACVIASRLADADPGLSVMVIEAGPNNYKEPTVVYPGLFFSHFSPESRMNAVYTGEKSSEINDRPLSVLCGRVLGGGSTINSLMYARGQKSDYDGWRTPGWTATELLPYFKKVDIKFESYHGEGEPANHGYDGPIHVSEGTYRCNKAMDDLMGVINRAGWPENKDLQSLNEDAINGVQRSLRYVSTDGKRQDAAHCYVHPRLRDGKHPNLHVLVETQVIKVVLREGKAVGVVCRPNPELRPQEIDSQPVEIAARKLVVISSGSFGSPAILERSGIGSGRVLQLADVPVIEELPGVGDNYDDHQFINYAYRTSLGPDDTVDRVILNYQNQDELIRDNSPMLGHNAQELGLKVRPTTDEVKSLGKAFQTAWEQHFSPKPDKPLALMSFITWYVPHVERSRVPAYRISSFPGHEPNLDPGQYTGMLFSTAHPFSRGYVHITGSSVSDPVDFNSGFFTDKDAIDLATHVWGYKKQRELMRRMKSYRGEFASWHPPFPAHSKAACIATDGPLPDDTPDIEYSAEDDVVIEGFVRGKVASLWHGMGTCKMAPREANGVVDASLSVHGVERLKVADMSIVPGNVAANTASTAYAVGEKAADLIIAELSLK
ncbi:hypothetical protein QQS21_008223 [Conoideocrella luteorostrata]|uniref:Glucose-methanol-choline oxidoreductase N-terminal domain-containing protein n=1 Tax=Conoideocrella luteorostrata TaxID=1105319 RepID=A0AAJ0FW76_9HYPO|nr:hypothetical protein QQS21_008223 [Conoideocrella luteorostrata]